MDVTIFSLRLRETRKSVGFSQKTLASLIGSDRTSIAAYENGHNTPTLDRTVAIADALNISLDWLCGRTDKKEWSVNTS